MKLKQNELVNPTKKFIEDKNENIYASDNLSLESGVRNRLPRSTDTIEIKQKLPSQIFHTGGISYSLSSLVQ